MNEHIPPPDSHEARITKLEKTTKPPRARGKGRAKAEAAGNVESAIAAAIRQSNRKEGDDPALEDFREQLFGELAKLIPEAIAQAKGQRAGKRKKEIPPRPALLRILTRFSR
jgi:hypothetical protein